jgi:hypothetical protein
MQGLQMGILSEDKKKPRRQHEAADAGHMNKNGAAANDGKVLGSFCPLQIRTS